MKTVIYYFSGTGNSLFAAKTLKAQMDNAELVAVKNIIKDKVITPKCETIVIVFPVYMWGPPIMIMDLINKLSVTAEQKVYFFATYGGMLARALCYTRDILTKKGIILQGGFAARMPGNFMPMYNVYPNDKQQALFKKAHAKITEAAFIIKTGAKYTIDTNLGFAGWLLTAILRKALEPKIKTNDKNFFADEKCNSCGICAKVCPVGNIIQNGKSVVWGGSCENCLACLHWCPQKAIQFGPKTASRGRYHQPEISLNDIIS